MGDAAGQSSRRPSQEFDIKIVTESGPLRQVAGLGEQTADVPASLSGLSRWACWRSRTKTYRDKYKDKVTVADRVVYEPLHPTTGRPLAVSRPDTWVTYEQACAPAVRKPVGGVGLLVRRDDGLAALRSVPLATVEQLGPSVVHAEQEVDGGGLVVIVRYGVFGARTNLFVPLSGRNPYQDDGPTPSGHGPCVSGRNPYQHPNEALSGRKPCQDAPCPDGIPAVRTESGRNPYQEERLSGRNPYQDEGVCSDGNRTFFSSSPPKDNYEGVEDGSVGAQVEQLANKIREQGKAGDPAKWLYGLIGVLKSNGVTAQAVAADQTLLLTFATAAGVDAGEVYRRVLARWDKHVAHKGQLADALRAVQANPALLTDLRPLIADHAVLTAAGMAKYMGAGGNPFAFAGRVLAEVLGLPGQQDGSEVVRALAGLGLVRKVAEARYADKKASEYVWTGPGATPPATASTSALLPVEQASAPAPQPVESASPAHQHKSGRPGHSTERTAEFCFPSKLGGFLTPPHYLAEKVLARELAQAGRELRDGFWRADRQGREYGRQVVAARRLLDKFSLKAVCQTLDKKQQVYSLIPSWVVDLVKKRQRTLDAQKQVAAMSLATPPPLLDEVPAAPAGPPPTVVARKTLMAKLKGL